MWKKNKEWLNYARLDNLTFQQPFLYHKMLIPYNVNSPNIVSTLSTGLTSDKNRENHQLQLSHMFLTTNVARNSSVTMNRENWCFDIELDIRPVTETSRLLAGGLFGLLTNQLSDLSNAYLKMVVRKRKLSICTHWSSCLSREKRTASIIASCNASETGNRKQDRT